MFHFDGQPASDPVVSAMRDTMTRRGPDDFGTWCQGQVGLGHRRLSILDLSSAAHQPMASADGRAVIVFNGEIYNYRELRSTLSAKGESFRSTSDTEVILSAYLRWGESVIEDLDGIFAFAIWDRQAKRLLLARDRMGVKPLYYSQTARSLWFASEVKAILVAEPSCASIDRERLYEQLVFRDVAGEHTLFENVVRLSPGGLLVASAEGTQRKRYWRMAEGI
ncbi:MAG: DUF1933 domain-containing protein, partial [Deltaproteobacteria bacterium]|nr:DUF1933 domain-containing protein [Deltaproteobacteria bacterium]